MARMIAPCTAVGPLNSALTLRVMFLEGDEKEGGLRLQRGMDVQRYTIHGGVRIKFLLLFSEGSICGQLGSGQAETLSSGINFCSPQARIVEQTPFLAAEQALAISLFNKYD